MPAQRVALVASAPVLDVRPRRLLRLVAEPPCAPARARHRPPDRAVLRAGRGLAVVLRRRAIRVTPLVHLVADYGPGDLAFAQTLQRLVLVAPEAQLCPTLAADTLAAGLCVAALALAAGP